MSMEGKISFLDGLRGIAAVNVMLMHFFIVLTPALIYSDQVPSHFGNFETIFSSSPLGLIGAGNFSVCIFFVLSGYVLTQKYFSIGDKNLIVSGILRRYIRLLIPVITVTLLSFLLSSFGLFHYYTETVMITANNNPANFWTGYWTFSPGIDDAIKQAVYDSFFVGDDVHYDPVLWTMTIEFYGSMLVFAIALLFGSWRKRWMFYLSAALVFFNSYYLAFIIGMALADIFTRKTPMFKTSNSIILSGVLFAGLFLGSYPVSTVTNDSLYSFLNNGVFLKPKMIYHIIGAGMIMYVLLNSERMQKVFSSSVPVFLGKISYSLYLIHFLIICSFTCSLFLALNPVLPYGLAVLTSCILSLLLIIPLSYLFYKYVDTLGVELSKNIYNKLFSPIISNCSGYIQHKAR